MKAHAVSFDRTVQKSRQWLQELCKDLGWHDEHRAYLALRAVLHGLRDRLTVEEVSQLGAQLPMLIRGFYYEGWKPRKIQPRNRHKDVFLKEIWMAMGRPDDIDIEPITNAVFCLLCNKVSEGELRDIVSILPRELKKLWPCATSL